MNLRDIRTHKPLHLNGRPPGISLLDPEDRMITLKKAAELTGVNYKRIYTAVQDRELRSYRFGPKSTRLLLSELQHWWKTFQVKSMNFPKTW